MMPKLFIGVFRSSMGGFGFDVSSFDKESQSKEYWEQGCLDVVEVIEVNFSRNCDVPVAVIKGLASTPDGVDALSVLLRVVVDHQRAWSPSDATSVGGDQDVDSHSA